MEISRKLFSFNTIQHADESVTARAGLVAFDSFMKAVKLGERINTLFPKPGSNKGYNPYDYVRSLILLQCAGGRDICDLRQIREDEALLDTIGDSVIPSDSAVGDWLLRTGEGKGISRLQEIHYELVRTLIRQDTAHSEYTLWADPTIIDLHDKGYAQKLYTGQRGDRPMILGLKELPLIVDYDYRKGNAMGGARDAVERGVMLIESAGKKVSHLALDSEFYVSDVINYAEGKHITYTIAADQDAGVQALIDAIPEESWKPLYTKDGIRTNREIATAIHSMNYTKPFRLIVLRWNCDEKGGQASIFYSYHAIATNRDIAENGEVTIEGKKIRVPELCTCIWKYNERVGMEHIIKEVKIGFNLEHMPCRTFSANALYFGIGMLSYNLFSAFKYFVMGNEMRHKTIASIRFRFLQIAGWIVSHGNRIIFKLATSVQKFKEYLRMLERIRLIASWSS